MRRCWSDLCRAGRSKQCARQSNKPGWLSFACVKVCSWRSPEFTLAWHLHAGGCQHHCSRFRLTVDQLRRPLEWRRRGQPAPLHVQQVRSRKSPLELPACFIAGRAEQCPRPRRQPQVFPGVTYQEWLDMRKDGQLNAEGGPGPASSVHPQAGQAAGPVAASPLAADAAGPSLAAGPTAAGPTAATPLAG